MPPFRALQAAHAQTLGERVARDIWLAAAAQLHGTDAASFASLTAVLVARQRLAEAVELADLGARLHPGAAAHFNLGYALQVADRHADAVGPYRTALASEPDMPSLRNNLAIIHLVRGDYATGWREHEARWEGSTEMRDRVPALPGRRWQGEPLAGKTLLMWGEQGMGDVLQFSRFVAPLAERVHREGGRLAWNTFPQVCTLMQRSLGACADHFSAGADVDALPPFDYELPLISLPLMLGTGDATLASSVAYLRADTQSRDRWRKRLAGETRLKVGLVWTGSAGHQRNPFRRVGLERYADAFRGMGGVAFYSLQPGADADVAAARAARFPIIDYTAELKSFDDTAAFIGALDLVITVCTSVAHLAGALGAPTWVLLDVNPHWPWSLERRDTPWYPTVTLYRQPVFGQWASVMEDVAHDLRCLDSHVCPPHETQAAQHALHCHHSTSAPCVQ